MQQKSTALFCTFISRSFYLDYCDQNKKQVCHVRHGFLSLLKHSSHHVQDITFQIIA